MTNKEHQGVAQINRRHGELYCIFSTLGEASTDDVMKALCGYTNSEDRPMATFYAI